jgi:Holliday junction resolvasome RuvABC endonuclease subunit
MKILGVDPGIHGGLAIVTIDDGAVPQLLDAIDIPVVGVKAKERVDVLAIRTWLRDHRPNHALIERAQAMPRQGASSGFKYGRAVGAIEAAIVICEIPMTIVEPTAWKKFHGLRGGDKEAGRQRALHSGCARSACSTPGSRTCGSQIDRDAPRGNRRTEP